MVRAGNSDNQRSPKLSKVYQLHIHVFISVFNWAGNLLTNEESAPLSNSFKYSMKY